MATRLISRYPTNTASASGSSEVGIIETEFARYCKSPGVPFIAKSRSDLVIVGVFCCLCLPEVLVDIEFSDGELKKPDCVNLIDGGDALL